MVTSGAYVEAVVTLLPGANAERVRSWFEKYRFTVSRMAAGGLLVSGAGSLFAKALGITEIQLAARDTCDVPLSVPADLHESVASIAIRRSPTIHGQ